jgi:hypothetical protein
MNLSDPALKLESPFQERFAARKAAAQSIRHHKQKKFFCFSKTSSARHLRREFTAKSNIESIKPMPFSLLLLLCGKSLKHAG